MLKRRNMFGEGLWANFGLLEALEQGALGSSVRVSFLYMLILYETMNDVGTIIRTSFASCVASYSPTVTRLYLYVIVPHTCRFPLSLSSSLLDIHTCIFQGFIIAAHFRRSSYVSHSSPLHSIQLPPPNHSTSYTQRCSHDRAYDSPTCAVSSNNKMSPPAAQSSQPPNPTRAL